MKKTLRVEELDIMAGGRRIRVQTLGEVRGAPALVFLHEGLGSISQWRDFPEALARAAGLPALVYDRYGYGASEAREGPQVPDFFEVEARTFLPGVLEACGVDRPFLVGHSDGGTIALLYAALFPERPLGLIAEAAHVFVEEVSLENIAKATRAFRTTPLRDKLQRHHGAKVASMFHGWSDVWLSPEHRDWRIVDRLAAIIAPVLVLQGADDGYRHRRAGGRHRLRRGRARHDLRPSGLRPFPPPPGPRSGPGGHGPVHSGNPGIVPTYDLIKLRNKMSDFGGE